MSKTVRVLVTFFLDGQEYQPNNVLELDDKTAKSLEKDSSVDSTPEAVAYCVEQLGAKVIKHIAADAEVVVDSNTPPAI